MSPLDDLLAAIDPRRTFEKRAMRVDEGLNRFAFGVAVVTRWDEFRLCMARLYRHLDNALLKPGRDFPLDFEHDWSMCVNLLNMIYGRHGFRTAFKMARSGCEGGLHALSRAVARRLAEERAGNYVKYLVDSFLDSAYPGYENRIAIAEEYLGKFGHLLPADLAQGSPAFLASNLATVLEQHPRLIRKLQQIPR